VVESLSARSVKQLLTERPKGEYVLLDVREPAERATAAIEPSLYIPMSEVPDRLAELPHDRKLIVYCHHGSRSAMVGAYLEGEGFASVANLEGGIDAWSQDVDPSVPRYL
jgi:rhodanese-related sulfurtransferase